MIKTQSGYAMVSLCLLGPVIALVFYGIAWSYWTVNQRERLEHSCHTGVLKAQHQLIRAGQKIMALNPQAQALATELKVIRALLKVAVFPAARAALVARKMAVRARQSALAVRQKSLMVQGQWNARSALGRAKKNIRLQLRRANQHPWVQSSLEPDVAFTPPKLGLVRKTRDLAPVYRYSPHYARRQQLQMQWRASWTLKKFLSTPTLQKWKGACWSHPKKRRRRWTANLGKAKSLWNRSGT